MLLQDSSDRVDWNQTVLWLDITYFCVGVVFKSKIVVTLVKDR
jgi:hypothetical protein